MDSFAEEMRVNQERLEGKIKASNEKFGVLQEELEPHTVCLTSRWTPIIKGQWPVKKS
jgi:hypothetical protein